MTALLAAIPLAIAVLGLALRWRANVAALVAIVAAALLTVWTFPTPVGQLAGSGQTMVPTLVEVLLILFGGVLIAELLARTGAQARIAAWIEQACAGRADRASLLIVLGIIPFAESLTGFGMGAVVAIPLLLHLGFQRTQAVLLGLFGLVLTTWGALAPGALIAGVLADVDVLELGTRSAAMAGVPIFLAGFGALWITYGIRAFQPPQLFGNLLELLLIGGGLWLSLWLANLTLGPALAGALGGLCAIAIGLLRFRLVDHASLTMDRATLRALVPYGVLVIGLLLCTVVLRSLAVTGPLLWLGHGSVWLLIACAVGVVLFGLRGVEVRSLLHIGVGKWWPVASATGGFLVLGALLTAAGMSAALAEGLTRVGPAYLFLAPFLGGLGGFIAGSNAGANAMFAGSQAYAATSLGVDRLQMVSVQNLSSGVLTLAAPSRIALAGALVVREGTRADDPLDTGIVYKATLGLGFAVMTLLGIINWIVLR